MGEIEHSEHEARELVAGALLAGVEVARKVRDANQAERRRLEGEISRLRAAISWARGQCTDEAPHTEIDAGLGRALNHPGGAVGRWRPPPPVPSTPPQPRPRGTTAMAPERLIAWLIAAILLITLIILVLTIAD